MAKEILCAFGIDVDAVAGWLGSYGGEDSPDDISRGIFAGEVGSPRLLKLFERLGIKTTWFIPGHSIETFPKEMKAVADSYLTCTSRYQSPAGGPGVVRRKYILLFGKSSVTRCRARNLSPTKFPPSPIKRFV